MNTNKDKWKKLLNSPPAIILAAIACLLIIFMIMMITSFHETKEYQEANPPIEEERLPDDLPTRPAMPEDEISYEDESILSEFHYEGIYKNKQLTCEVGYGRYITIGIDDDSLTDALYLNPQFNYEFAANSNEKYGFIITGEHIPVHYPEGITFADASDAVNYDINNFFFTDWTHKQVIPSDFADTSDYGVCWAKDTLIGAHDFEGDILHIKVIRLSDMTIMGAAIAEIDYNNITGESEITEFKNADLVSQGMLDTDARNNLINTAINFLQYDCEFFTIGNAESNWQTNPEVVIVEHLHRPISPKFVDINGDVIRAGEFANSDFYTVHIPYTGQGFYTFYFLPRNQADKDNSSLLPYTELILIGFENSAGVFDFAF